MDSRWHATEKCDVIRDRRKGVEASLRDGWDTAVHVVCVCGGGCWETLDTSNDQEYSCPLTYYSTSRNSSWNKFLGVLRCSLASVFSEVWRILTGRRADCIWQLLIKYMKVTEEYTILLMITSLCVCVCMQERPFAKLSLVWFHFHFKNSSRLKSTWH